jgi:hypothetical protein
MLSCVGHKKTSTISIHITFKVKFSIEGDTSRKETREKIIISWGEAHS